MSTAVSYLHRPRLTHWLLEQIPVNLTTHIQQAICKIQDTIHDSIVFNLNCKQIEKTKLNTNMFCFTISQDDYLIPVINQELMDKLRELLFILIAKLVCKWSSSPRFLLTVRAKLLQNELVSHYSIADD